MHVNRCVVDLPPMHSQALACFCLKLLAFACCCLRLLAFACVCLRLLHCACVGFRLLAFACFCLLVLAFACICLLLLAFVCFARFARLLGPSWLAGGICSYVHLVCISKVCFPFVCAFSGVMHSVRPICERFCRCAPWRASFGGCWRAAEELTSGYGGAAEELLRSQNWASCSEHSQK